MVIEGRCLCGRIQFQVLSIPEIMGVCHCKHCQRQSGSAFSTMAGIPGTSFQILSGRPRTYRNRKTASGDPANICFCGHCGSPIHTTLASQPDFLYLKTGTLGDTSWFKPQFHVWCADKQDWVDIEVDEEGSLTAPGNRVADQNLSVRS